MLRTGVSGSQGSCKHSSLKNPHAVPHYGYTNLHSHQQSRRVPAARYVLLSAHGCTPQLHIHIQILVFFLFLFFFHKSKVILGIQICMCMCACKTSMYLHSSSCLLPLGPALLSLVCMLHTAWLWATTGTSVPAGSLLQGKETACRSPGNSLCKSGPFLSSSKLSLPQDTDQVPKREERWERGMVQGHGVPRNPGRWDQGHLIRWLPVLGDLPEDARVQRAQPWGWLPILGLWRWGQSQGELSPSKVGKAPFLSCSSWCSLWTRLEGCMQCCDLGVHTWAGARATVVKRQGSA